MRQLRDPGDEMVLEVAINRRADALVTFNLRLWRRPAVSAGLSLRLPRSLKKAVERLSRETSINQFMATAGRKVSALQTAPREGDEMRVRTRESRVRV